ncbi:MAG: M20 family metallo-hydrolase [Eubacteriales bacterium]|nr:M20 family metallo-hydrolase [Eubacteriales bacterium]
MMQRANVKMIKEWIQHIDTFKIEGAGTTRLPLSKEEMECRSYIMKEMEKFGLQVNVDAIGNIMGILPGSNDELPAVWTGSHIDTVKEAGMFDGVAGVVAGLEAVRLIKEAGLTLKRNLCVNIYTSEESTRFSMGCIGSRAMAGHLMKEELGQIKDMNGISLKELLEENGFNLNEYDKVRKERRQVHAAVELHIEQSPNLEKHKKSVGIVDAICAPSNLILTLHGIQSHAGGTSMTDRSDAFMAAAEIALALEEVSKQGMSAYTTGTVGYVSVLPNAVNVIPGKVIMSIDVRDCEQVSKTYVVTEFMKRAKEICAKRKIKLKIEKKCDDIPFLCDPQIISAIVNSCKFIQDEEEVEFYMHLMSGAYHDSLFLGEFAPVGMIFVPSRDGISHSPLEWTDYEDIAKGIDVLTHTLIQLANE